MKVKVWRSAIDGRFVSKDYALANPHTTVMETMVVTDDMPELPYGYVEPHEPMTLFYPLTSTYFRMG